MGIPSIFHSKTATALGTWIGIGTGVLGLMSFLTPEWFGKLTLPQSVLAGFGMALVATVVLTSSLAFGAYAFRLLKPYQPPAPLPPSSTGIPIALPHDPRIPEIRDDIKTIEGEIAAITDTYLQTAAAQDQFTQFTESIEQVSRSIEAHRIYFSRISKHILDALGFMLIADELDALIPSLAAKANDLWDTCPKKMHDPVDPSDQAKWEREYHAFEQSFARLYDLSTISEWLQIVLKNWESSRQADFVRVDHMDIREGIKGGATKVFGLKGHLAGIDTANLRQTARLKLIELQHDLHIA